MTMDRIEAALAAYATHEHPREAMIRAIAAADRASMANAEGVVRDLVTIAVRIDADADLPFGAADTMQQAAATIQAMAARVAELEAAVRYGIECRIIEDGRERGWRLSAGAAVGKPDLYRWLEMARSLLAEKNDDA